MATKRSVSPSTSDPLWHALRSMQVEPAGAGITFTAKLASDNGWSRQFAEAVTCEYRRFLYLAATAGEPVTPSPAVDKAWHLHLTYSRHYWDELCGNILRRPFHHDPSLGGAAEDERHASQYERTLAGYRATFGEEPPAEIWAPPAAPQVLGRSTFRRAFTLSGAAAATLLLAACTALAANGGSGSSFVGWFPLIFVGAFVLIVGIAMAAARGKGRRGDGDGGSSCGGGGSSSDGDSSCGSSCGGGCGGGGD